MIIRNKNLILAIVCLPSAAYIAWQLIGSPLRAVRGSPPPEVELAPAEQIKKTRDEAAALKTGTDPLTESVFRFDLPRGNSTDPKPVEAVRLILEGHFKDLNDLERFLRPTTGKRKYGGRNEQFYAELDTDRATLVTIENRVKGWFESPINALNVPEAERRFAALTDLLDEYTHRNLSDTTKAENWRLEGLVRLVNELRGPAKEQYLVIARTDAKLDGETQTLIQRLLEWAATIAAKQGDPLIRESGRIEARRMEVVKEDWQARLKLLELFTTGMKAALETPEKVPTWFSNVQSCFDQTKDAEVHAVVREKVAKLCSLFIPAKLRLDSSLVFLGQLKPRSGVRLEWPTMPDMKVVPFSYDPDSDNEFTAREKPGKPHVFGNWGGEALPQDVGPTPKSVAVYSYRRARKDVTIWMSSNVDDLKKLCDEPVNQIKVIFKVQSELDLLGKLPLPREIQDALAQSQVFIESEELKKSDKLFNIGQRLDVIAKAIRDHSNLFPRR